MFFFSTFSFKNIVLSSCSISVSSFLQKFPRWQSNYHCPPSALKITLEVLLKKYWKSYCQIIFPTRVILYIFSTYMRCHPLGSGKLLQRTLHEWMLSSAIVTSIVPEGSRTISSIIQMCVTLTIRSTASLFIILKGDEKNTASFVTFCDFVISAVTCHLLGLTGHESFGPRHEITNACMCRRRKSGLSSSAVFRRGRGDCWLKICFRQHTQWLVAQVVDWMIFRVFSIWENIGERGRCPS